MMNRHVWYMLYKRERGEKKVHQHRGFMVVADFGMYVLLLLRHTGIWEITNRHTGGEKNVILTICIRRFIEHMQS